MKLITAIYMSDDGKVFNSVTAQEECRRYETDLRMKPIRVVLEKIGYEEKSIGEEYNQAFPRRHSGILCHAMPRNREEYEACLMYVEAVHGGSKELRDMRKLNPLFPMDLNLVVHKSVKHHHVEIYQREITDGLSGKKTVQPAPHENEAAQTKSKMKGWSRQPKYFTYNGETHSIREWAKLKNIDPSTMSMRFRTMSVEEAITKPVRRYRDYRTQPGGSTANPLPA